MTSAGPPVGGVPKILVIGAGSIGQRHAENLSDLGAKVAIADVSESALTDLPHETLTFDAEVPHGYDGIVIATPTRLHAQHALSALRTDASVFVEKPLAWTTEEGNAVLDAGRNRIMVGYNLRFHAPLQRVAELLADGRIGTPSAYRFWFGYWLPDWRPLVDYRTSYSARSELGGGVLFDAIHELDMAVWMVDAPMEVEAAIVGRFGPLEIDVEDTVRALLRTKAGIPVSVELDYLSRQYRRGVEVTGEDGTLRYDWATGNLDVFTSDETDTEHFDTPVADSYRLEMAEFLEFVGGATTRNTAATGFMSLLLADQIRLAS